MYRDVYISHYTLTNQNATISPVATTNTSTISVSFSVPISFSASTTIGVSTGIQKYSGGIGSDCIQWNFYPCVLGAKTYSPNASHYICASEYTQPGNHYYGYINYSFQMYERSGSGATPYQYVDNDNGTSGY